MCFQNPRHGQRSAVSAIEFAVILPLLVMLVIGCVDFGRFAYSYVAISNAARAGAYFGCFHPFTADGQAGWEAGIRQAVANEMQLITDFDPNGTNPDGTRSIVISYIASDDEGFPEVTVQVSYNFTMLMSWPTFPQSTTMQRTVVMRFIRSN